MQKLAPQVIHRKVRLRARTPAPFGGVAQPLPPAIERQRPGKGYRHLLRAPDVISFLSILPDWGDLSRGLHTIVLARGSDTADGWHHPGIVAVCAWTRTMWRVHCEEFHRDHEALFERLGVPVEETDEGWLTHFTEATARAYQLLNVLLHELGHHHDRMTTRSQRRSSRGEGFAERYAAEYADRIWDRHFEVFGW